MKQSRKSQIGKVGLVYRVLSFLLFVLCILGGLGIAYMMFSESFSITSMLFLLPPIILGHISGSVALTGYAPKYLWFSHGAKS